MLRGDVLKLAKILNCSKTTVYNLSEKSGIDLQPIYGRCNKTVDILSGKTLAQEREEWLSRTVEKILKFKADREKEKADKRVRKDNL